MPNIASVLKNEISRLSNKAARQHVAPVQSTTAALRRQVAALKKQVQMLEREMAALKRQLAAAGPDRGAEEESNGDARVRFTAKGLRSLRGRLGLSAEEFGRLLQVGAQTIYNWESQKTQPRRTQVPAIAALRKLGKREVRARLNGVAVAAEQSAEN
jgi:DNA-binding transcriptional regulator YiaG